MLGSDQSIRQTPSSCSSAPESVFRPMNILLIQRARASQIPLSYTKVWTCRQLFGPIKLIVINGMTCHFTEQSQGIHRVCRERTSTIILDGAFVRCSPSFALSVFPITKIFKFRLIHKLYWATEYFNISSTSHQILIA